MNKRFCDQAVALGSLLLGSNVWADEYVTHTSNVHYEHIAIAGLFIAVYGIVALLLIGPFSLLNVRRKQIMMKSSRARKSRQWIFWLTVAILWIGIVLFLIGFGG